MKQQTSSQDEQQDALDLVERYSGEMNVSFATRQKLVNAKAYHQPNCHSSNPSQTKSMTNTIADALDGIDPLLAFKKSATIKMLKTRIEDSVFTLSPIRGRLS